MAIFGTKSTKKEEKKGPRVTHARAKSLPAGREHEFVHAPWLSEKALIGTERGVYAFVVPRSASKEQIAGAIKAIYKVSPRKIRVVNLPGKRKALRTRPGYGKRARRRKAYVYLNAGETIQFA